MTAMSSFLRFHDLTKSYYEGDVRRVVLQNAHAEFQPGEITDLGRCYKAVEVAGTVFVQKPDSKWYVGGEIIH